MLFNSPVYSQVSGSIAGLTYSHGRSGLIVKPRGTPVNPDSARQRTIRHAVARLGSYWGQNLTKAERAAWRMYASNVPGTNALGQTMFLTGHQHFLRCNIPRIQASIEILDAAPTIYDLGTYTRPILFALSDWPMIQISCTGTDDWATTAGGYLLAYSGITVGPGHKFFRGPWRYAGKAVGNPDPPPWNVTEVAPWPQGEGNIGWAYCRIIQSDGRLSPPLIDGPKTVAAAGDMEIEFFEPQESPTED